MIITFLIGNGFDSNLNLKTKYSEFYPHYLEKHPDTQIAKDIMKNHNEESEKPWEYWSDLELGLGEYLVNINTDEEVEKFLDEKAELESCLADYLASENNKITEKMYSIISDEFKKKILSLKSKLTEVESNHYSNVLFTNDGLRYAFITFNYTNVLDIITEFFPSSSGINTRRVSHNTEVKDYISNPLHVHGKLSDNSLILGINDISQIKNEKLRNNRVLNDYLIKENVNRASGSLRMDKCIDLIDSSTYICIYGLSMGQTDFLWWKIIANWLKGNSNRRIIYCVYEENPQIIYSQPQKNRLNDKSRDQFLDNCGVNDTDREKLRKQIVILRNTDLFTFSVKAPDQPNLGNDKDDEKELATNEQT